MSIQGAYLRVSHCSVLFAVFWLLRGADTSSSNVNYSVKPEGSIGPCPDPCRTLAGIAALSTSDADQGLFGDASTNVTMTLLPGEHRLNTTLKISNGAHFALVGGGQSYSEYAIIFGTGANIDIDNVTEIFFDSFSINSNEIRYDELISVMHVEYISVTSLLVSGQHYILLNIYSLSSVLIRDSVFTEITFEYGLFVVDSSSITFTGNTVCNNTLQDSEFFFLTDSSITFTGNTVSNNALQDSEFFVLTDSSITFTGNTVSNNALQDSEFFFLTDSSITFTGNTVSNNTLQYSEFFYSEDNISITFTDNTVSNNILQMSDFATLEDHSEVILEGENMFSNNSGSFNYGLWYLDGTTRFSLKGDSSFIDNSITIIFAYMSNISFEGNTIIRNSVCLTPILVTDTTIDFNGSVIFSDNHGTNLSGAITLRNTVMNVWDNSSLVFRNNLADRYGGAIFVDDISNYNTAVQESCFMQFPKQWGTHFTILFENNHALLGGEDIYGGNVLKCTLENNDIASSLFDVLSNDDYVTFVHDNGTLSSITSNPLEICLCEDNQIMCCPTQGPNGIPQCETNTLGTVYPGQNVHLSAVAVGQTHGTVTSEVYIFNFNIIRINRSEMNITVETLKLTQLIYTTCNQIQYQVDSINEVVTLNLYPMGVCDPSKKLQVGIMVNTTCPPGFKLDNATKQCVCEVRLQSTKSVHCDIDNQAFTHDNRVWIGYQESLGIIIHSSPCPFDYCQEGKQVFFTLNNTDKQCSNNRTGILCSECKERLSVLLGGTSQCEQCSNAYLGFILLFALAGLALIAIIFLLKMTVKYGTLSGLVFYANLVQVNRTLFLPEGQTNVLTIFVAWLNLDFGINTCFYDGLDAYGKTWLQFLFPFYIWIIIGGIILASHFSMRVTKALGSSPISVLATLILLSYVKIFQTCIAVISVTSLEYSTKTESVWKLDGNIKYFTGKHVPLFLFSLAVLILLFLPFTLLLLFGQWIQHITRWQTLSKTTRYVQRLSHFLDPYHAPYKPRHRYWPGLLLVVRVILTVISSVSDNTRVISAVIIAVIFLLQLWGSLSGGLYRKWSLNALEASFMFNLGLLTIASNNSQTDDQKTAIAYTSMSIAFLTFCGVVAYHVYHQICNIYPKFQGKCLKKPTTAEISEIPSQQTLQLQPVSKTIVAMEDHQARSYSLREPLLDDNDSSM